MSRDRVAYVMDTLGHKIQKAYTNDTFAPKGLTVPEVIHQLQNLDCSHGKYLLWLANRYAHQNFRMEDRDKVQSALLAFDKAKPDLLDKDINHFRSISELENLVLPKHLPSRRELKKEGTERFYEGSDCIILKLKTEEAASYYGSNTRWCTASDKNNMFLDYITVGPLYILIDSDHRKFQIHFATKQFKNELDDDVSREWLRKKFKGFRLLETSLLSCKSSIINRLPYILEPIDQFHSAINFVIEQDLMEPWPDLIYYMKQGIRATINLIYKKGFGEVSMNLSVLNLLNKYVSKLSMEALEASRECRWYEFKQLIDFIDKLYNSARSEIKDANIKDKTIEHCLLGTTISSAEMVLDKLKLVKVPNKS